MATVGQQPESVLPRAALWFAIVLKFYIFPVFEPMAGACSCGNPECEHPGKHPREKQIRQWWGMWPNASIGIACGQSGLLVLDHDVRKGRWGTHGDMAEYVHRVYGPLPETCTVLTGSADGSSHDYYRFSWTDEDHAPSELEPGLDLKGKGGYVIAPPSKHYWGGTYEVDGIDGAKEFLKIAPAAPWMGAFIRNRSPKQQNRGPDTEETWTKGSRNDKLFKLACSLRGPQGMTVEEITTILKATNRVHCEPPFADSEVATSLALRADTRGENSRRPSKPRRATRIPTGRSHSRSPASFRL